MTTVGEIMDKLSTDVTVLARMALGNGITRAEAAEVLRTAADAIETQDVAEDMSPIASTEYKGEHRRPGTES